MTVTRVVIVDDEAPARRRLRRMLERIGGIEVVGEAQDGIEARELFESVHPDVAFLDIDMPGLDGLSVAAERPNSGRPPAIIFVTAHPKHAVEAFDLEATDYLLKPVTAERLRKSLRRVPAQPEAPGRADEVERRPSGHGPRVTARHGSTIHVFDARQIERLSASDKCVILRHEANEYLVDRSLTELQQQLEDFDFLRVHRKELINLAHLERVHTEDGMTEAVMKSGQHVPVSRRQTQALKRRLGIK